ncbi:MAG: hypothetical protein JWM68_244 [Verrucomicrobiales bacterium]|nr:hypothetical protein [Verrucomicrobiales bacterium]
MDMSPQDAAKKILERSILNLAKKVSDGGTLTAQEYTLLNQFTEGTGGGSVGPAWVQKQTELADVLNVTRKTIQRWLKLPDNPGTGANGKYSVVAWRTFAKQRGHDDESDSVDELDKPKLQAEQIELQNEKLRHSIGVLKERYIEKQLARQVFGKLLLSAKGRSYSNIIRIVTLARLAPDTTTAAAEVRKEIDAMWQSLTDSSWLKE